MPDAEILALFKSDRDARRIFESRVVGVGGDFIGGIGQGLGYITPVSTLIKWFPDRRGMATGFAIMGYGGGAMIGSPLAVWLMSRFVLDGTSGVSTTLLAMGPS